MLRAFAHAVADTLRPEQRRVLLLSLLAALGLLAALWLGLSASLATARVAGIWCLDALIEVTGSLAALALAWLLFPATTVLVLSLVLDSVIANVESQRYPRLGAPRRLGAGAALASGLRLLLLAVALNLMVLPFYLLPAINFFIYYGLNGYLVGREFFELVALRRLDRAAARAMWRRHRVRLWSGGVIIVLLLSVPVINLVAPVIAAAFMLHIVEALRRRATTETFAGSDRSRLIED
jgi:uncharacterized protein involved in cysteine biosynthesis